MYLIFNVGNKSEISEPEEPEVEEVTEREYTSRPKAQSITPEDWQQMKQFTRQQTTRPDEVAGLISPLIIY